MGFLALGRGTFWYMLPIAIGLHVVALMWPMPPKPDPEVAQKKKPVPIVVASKSPTPTSQPSAPSTPPPPVRSSPAANSAPAASPVPAASPTPSPSAAPNPSPSPAPSTSTPSPSPSPSPSKPPDPDALQMSGATPCKPDSAACFRVAETNGRDVSIKLEDQLLTKGFALTSVDLPNDTGRKAYEVTKDGEVKYYLFMTWGMDGTIYEKFLTRGELDAKAAAS